MRILKDNLRPLVSVIIATYNRADYVGESINSVLNQSYQNVEIVVIDDGSTDNTKNVLSQYKNKIKYIYQENKGQAAARNNGIRESKGEFIAFLDSDDLLMPGAIELQVNALSSESNIKLAYGRIMEIDSKGRAIVTHRNNQRYKSGSVYGDLLLDYFIQTSTVMVRKECFNHIGYFDESIRGTEDWDMWLRISRHFKVQCIDAIIAKYRVHNANSIGNIDKLFKNELKVLRKHFRFIKSDDIKRNALFNIFYEYSCQLFYQNRDAEGQLKLEQAFTVYPKKLLERDTYNRWARNFIPRYDRTKFSIGKKIDKIENGIFSFLESFFENRFKEYKNRAFSLAHAEIGILFYLCRNLKKARFHLIKANLLNPRLMLKPIIASTFLKSFIRTVFIKFIDNEKLDEKLLISAIICTKDREQDLLKCVNSVLKQGHLPLEIIIVDSTEAPTLEKKLFMLHKRFSMVSFKYFHTKPGLTYQRNIGIEKSRGDTLMFLDDDLILEKNFIEEIIKIFSKDSRKRIGGVMGNILNANIKRSFAEKIKRKLFFLPEYGKGKFKLSGATTSPIGNKKVLETEYLAGGLTAYRKDVFKKFKFDNSFFYGYAYLEDDDFSYRVSRKYINIYTPNAKCFHYDSLNNRLSPKQFREMYVQNFQYFFKKNMPQTFIHKIAFRIALFGITNRVDQLPFSQIFALVLEVLIGKEVTEVLRKQYKRLKKLGMGFAR